MNREAFIKNTGLFSLATTFNPYSFIENNKLIKNIGLGLFSIPKKLDTNFEEAISMVASMGFKEIELYGPYDFSTEKAKNNWNAITPQLGFKGSGFFGKTAEVVKKISKSHGISIPSLHTDFDTLQNNITPLLDAANLLGAKYVVLPSIPDENRQTVDDYKRTAALFNRIGENAKNKVFVLHTTIMDMGYKRKTAECLLILFLMKLIYRWFILKWICIGQLQAALILLSYLPNIRDVIN